MSFNQRDLKSDTGLAVFLQCTLQPHTRTQLHSYPSISPADAHKQNHILTIWESPHGVDILLEMK
jgi:hypothetical protein